MPNPNVEDHVVGLELQLVELVEREHRAEVQGLDDQVAELRPEIQDLQAELASWSERLGTDDEVDPSASATVAADPVSQLYKSA